MSDSLPAVSKADRRDLASAPAVGKQPFWRRLWPDTASPQGIRRARLMGLGGAWFLLGTYVLGLAVAVVAYLAARAPQAEAFGMLLVLAHGPATILAALLLGWMRRGAYPRAAFVIAALWIVGEHLSRVCMGTAPAGLFLGTIASYFAINGVRGAFAPCAQAMFPVVAAVEAPCGTVDAASPIMGGEPLPDTAAIDQFEAERGIRLPASYRRAVMAHDGGLPAARIAVDTPAGPMALNALVPFLDRGEDGTMGWLNRPGQPVIPTGLVVFGLEAGGCMFAFDYREGREDPPVVVLVRGLAEGMVVQEAAPSFDALLRHGVTP